MEKKINRCILTGFAHNIWLEDYFLDSQETGNIKVYSGESFALYLMQVPFPWENF